MNKLKHLRCYLAGHMEFDDLSGRQWRAEIRDFLSDLGVWVQNPLEKPFSEIEENEQTKEILLRLRSEKRFDEITEYRNIRQADLRMVDTSDFLIANLIPGVPTCGTWEEITTANRAKRPIIVRCEKIKAPIWLFWMLPHRYIMNTWDEVKQYLEGVNDGTITDTRRWLFPDYTKIAPPLYQNSLRSCVKITGTRSGRFKG